MAVETTNRDLARLLLAFRTKLNSDSKLYVVNKETLSTESKYYDYQPTDIRYLRFAQGAMGSYSDCFILYAVAMMGVADKRAIRQFLLSLKKKQPELDICAEDEDGLENRIKMLRSNGFLFQHRYHVESTMANSDRKQENAVVLYTIDKDSLSFMNQKLSTRVAPNTWISAKPLHELIGWAAASYIGTLLSKNEAFISFKEAIFRTKHVGVVFFPIELLMGTGQNAYRVGVMPSFLYQDKRVQGNEAYAKTKVQLVNNIFNYFHSHEANGRAARVVVAVHDINDAEAMKQLILQTEILVPHLEKIYFTGEGVANSPIGVSSMLRLEDTKEDYIFNVVKPDFIV